VSEFTPRAAVEDGVLRVQLLEAHPARLLDIDCVVDLTDLGQVVGIEVLDLRSQLAGGTVGPLTVNSSIRWSYDDEIDALYVHVAAGRGQVQRRTAAQAGLDSNDRVVELAVPLA
jgi:uncharacterized protein YuzE